MFNSVQSINEFNVIKLNVQNKTKYQFYISQNFKKTNEVLSVCQIIV